MASVIHKQANFTRGELDDRLIARTDIGLFEKGARRLRNVVILPQGGVQRRFGTSYITPLAIATTASECRIFQFELSDQSKALLLFENLSLKIYVNDALSSTLVSPYTAAQLPDVKVTQSIDEFFTFHQDIQPYRLTVAPFAYAVVTFRWRPTYDFDRNYDAATFTPGGTTGTMTLAATGSPFKPAHVDGMFFSNDPNNAGTLRITSYTNPNLVGGITITDFQNTNTINGNLVVLTEPVWSAALGWPGTGTFFQDRLWLAAAKALRQGIWASKINEYLNFDDSQALDNDSISVYINSNNANVVEDILGYHTFTAFTSSGVVTTPFIDDSPITPTNISFNIQTQDGIGNVRAQIFDNGLIYIDKGGKIAWSVKYDVQRAGYVFNDISIPSQSLIRNPIEMAAFRNPQTDQGNYLILVNEDGTLAILQSIGEQEVRGWSLSDTDGLFRHVAASDNQVYFIVERVINSVTKFYIEKLDFNVFMDSQVSQTFGGPTSVITGLGSLEGKTVSVIADGYNVSDEVVSSGQITLNEPATIVDVGLNFIPLVIPLPLSIALQIGNNYYLPKRTKTLWIDYFESLGIWIDDFEIPSLQFNVDTMGNPTPPKNGVYEHTLMNGWDPRVEVEITQQKPAPMLIRGLGFLVEIDANA